MSELTERYPGFGRRLARQLIASGYVRHVGKKPHPDITRFAKALPVSRKMAWLWVQGRAFPEHHLPRIGELLGVRVEALLYPPPPENLAHLMEELIPPMSDIKVLGPVFLSTGYPEVDAMVAYVRGELTQIWEDAESDTMRREFMAHYANQVRLFRRWALRQTHDPKEST